MTVVHSSGREGSSPAARSGFTLVELMVVVAIVGLLAAIAYPSYVAYVIRANRADAQQSLLQLQQNMERYYAAQNTYATADTATNIGPDQSPDGGDARYTLAIQAQTATTYTLRATPVSGGPNEDDGYLEVDSRGRKAWDKNDDGSISSDERTWSKN